VIPTPLQPPTEFSNQIEFSELVERMALQGPEPYKLSVTQFSEVVPPREANQSTHSKARGADAFGLRGVMQQTTNA
jgi:hypothetical protein